MGTQTKNEVTHSLRHRALSRFLLAFFASALVMALPMAITISYIAPSRPSLSDQRAEAQTGGIYLPDRGDSLAMLFAGLNRDGELDYFTLVHADPMNHSLWVCMLPADCMTEAESGLMTLAEAYDRGGVFGAASALSETADIYIHRSAAVSAFVFGNIVDAAGPVEMTLPVGIDIPEAGAHIEAGRQRMNGTRLIALMDFGAFPDGEAQRLELLGEAIRQTARKYLDGFGSDSGERLFTAFMHTLDQSNLSMADYEYRRSAFAYLHGREDLAVTLQVIGWVDTEAGRFLTQEGIEDLQAACYRLSSW